MERHGMDTSETQPTLTRKRVQETISAEEAFRNNIANILPPTLMTFGGIYHCELAFEESAEALRDITMRAVKIRPELANATDTRTYISIADRVVSPSVPKIENALLNFALSGMYLTTVSMLLIHNKLKRK